MKSNKTIESKNNGTDIVVVGGSGAWLAAAVAASEKGGVPPFGEPYEENFNRYFNQIYFDMAGSEGGMNTVKCVLTAISTQRLLFGTDYPPNFTDNPRLARDYINNIRKLDLPADSAEAMLGMNAAKLLGIWKGYKSLIFLG